MKKLEPLRRFILKMPGLLEKIVAVFLIIAVGVGCVSLGFQIFAFSFDNYTGYIDSILVTAFNIILAIEFVRMLIRHSLNSIIEVLIFSFSRSLAVGKQEPVMVAICIVSIVVLLFCRKFFFYEFDFREDKHAVMENEQEGKEGKEETDG